MNYYLKIRENIQATDSVGCLQGETGACESGRFCTIDSFTLKMLNHRSMAYLSVIEQLNTVLKSIWNLMLTEILSCLRWMKPELRLLWVGLSRSSWSPWRARKPDALDSHFHLFMPSFSIQIFAHNSPSEVPSLLCLTASSKMWLSSYVLFLSTQLDYISQTPLHLCVAKRLGSGHWHVKYYWHI